MHTPFPTEQNTRPTWRQDPVHPTRYHLLTKPSPTSCSSATVECTIVLTTSNGLSLDFLLHYTQHAWRLLLWTHPEIGVSSEGWYEIGRDLDDWADATVILNDKDVRTDKSYPWIHIQPRPPVSPISSSTKPTASAVKTFTLILHASGPSTAGVLIDVYLDHLAKAMARPYATAKKIAKCGWGGEEERERLFIEGETVDVEVRDVKAGKSTYSDDMGGQVLSVLKLC
ncbi:hypothetical protein DL96DRAFT_1606113 [Flagelloscypha sp. PMI_526]|nr:hypothetical protein DL96DRAFT_1606113 [Flagelloscypha sp. PMI_526]